MKARPILMSSPMVNALLQGKKTQTRRIIKGWHLNTLQEDIFTPEFVADDGNNPPYGKRGDLLYVRESICRAQEYGGIGYVADTTWYPNYAWLWKKDFLPSIHMPRWLSRLTLELTSVRVERLQDISEDDAIDEGARPRFDKQNPVMINNIPMNPLIGPQEDYRQIWESINGAGSWDSNPWVWALTFNVHQQNVDDFLKARVE